jgi:hypothetical protein
MDPIYVPLLSALAGAIIGSLSSIATILIQAKISDRRERLRQAALLAMEEFRAFFVWAESNSPQEDSQKGGVERVFGV